MVHWAGPIVRPTDGVSDMRMDKFEGEARGTIRAPGGFRLRKSGRFQASNWRIVGNVEQQRLCGVIHERGILANNHGVASPTFGYSSAQSLLFLCAREPGQQRCPRSRDPFAAGRRSDLPGKKCGLQWASCSTHYDNQNGLYFRVGNNRGKVTSSTDDAALSMNMVSVRSVASSPPSVRPPAFRS